jgi:hypothetical protein
MSVLVSHGFLTQKQGRFYVNDLSQTYLIPESPYYMGHLFVPHQTKRLEKFSKALKEESVWKKSDGWEEGLPVQNIPEFMSWQHAHSFSAATGMAETLDFSQFTRVLDMAGGSGSVLIALLLKNPHLEGTVFELPGMYNETIKYVKSFGLQDRIKSEEGDMFKDPWPDGHDAIIFSNIFHDWPEEKCLFLGGSAFEKLPSKGKVFLHEMLLNDQKDGPPAATAFSAVMLLSMKGRQYSGLELTNMLCKCGFIKISVHQTFGYYCTIQGEKP